MTQDQRIIARLDKLALRKDGSNAHLFPTHKGEQCVYCGKDSWTCEHFEESPRERSFDEMEGA